MKKVTILFISVSLFIPVGSATQAQTEWTKYEGNPVLVPGSAGSWDDDHLIEPHVLVFRSPRAEQYHMWYAGDDGSGNRIGYATSPDGVDWTKASLNPVLDLGASGSWEDNHVGAPNVLFDGSNFQMWYHGHDGTSFRTGHATSPDGVDWTKDGLNPVLDLGTSGSWDDVHVETPVVLKLDDTTFYMWYGGNDGSNTRIGLATSSDGIVWTKSESNPIMDIGTGWEGRSILPESVLYDGSLFQMWYLGFDQDFIGRSGYAIATDGITWTKSDSNPVLDIGAAGEWDAVTAAVGAVSITQQATYEMWYDNNDGANTSSIGYATAPQDPPVIGVTNEGVIPDRYILNLNYPNPFNPVTTLSYDLPAASNVRLVIYNLMGQEVRRWEIQGQTAGYHKVIWNASNLPSGIYFYRLQAGDFVKTRKMVLLK